MKIKFFLLVVLTTAFSLAALGQTVVVTSKKTVYKRPKPISDYKKSFAINYPKIKGVSPAIARKIENTISYEKVFDLKIREEISDVQWLEDADYQVDYNKNGILVVTLMIEGSGAYPSSVQKPVVVNLKTGMKVAPRDVFQNLNQLAARAKKIQQEEIKNAIVEIKKDEPDEDNPARLFENSNFTAADLNEFTVNDKGVTFWYDYGFPHVIQALQPEGRYFFRWAQLKPFIKPGGLFARFIR